MARVGQTTETAGPGFTGFGPGAFEFLDELAGIQSRDWFEAHKGDYEREVKGPMQALVAELSEALAARKLPLRGDPKRAMFRIHRDVRFSKDKRPYKTNAGATLTRDGGKLSPGLLYVHLDPEGCFTAAGFYRPEPVALKALRQAVVKRRKTFDKVLAELDAAGLALGGDDVLKRAPRGFEDVDDAAVLEVIKHKSFIVRRTLSVAEVADAGLVDRVVDFAEAALPLLRFGWAALDG